MILEKYDINKYFEIYFESMRSTFFESHFTEKDFLNFAGEHGEKYYTRLCKWLTDSNNFLRQIVVNGQIIGIIEATLIAEKNTAQLSSLYIRSDYRRKGYAKNTENLMVKHFQEIGINKIILNVSKENLTALNYYEKLGWKKSTTSMYPNSFKYYKEI